jgi:hypothetical protein
MTAAVVLLAALAAAGSWWWFGGQGHPRSRYLPRHSELFLWMSGPALAKCRFPASVKDTPGARLMERIRVFTQNAKLGFRDLECVTAGGTADGGNLIVVYRLTRPVRPEEIADQPSFEAMRNTAGPSESVGGTPVYRVGQSALAFPEPQVIVNGDLDLVREVLRAPAGGIARPLERLLPTADFSTTCLEMSVGVPAPLRASFLQAGGDLADAVVTTATSYTFGLTAKFRRTLHVRDAAAAERLKTCLEQSLRKAAQDSHTDEPLRTLLRAVHVSEAANTVEIELEVAAESLPPDIAKELRQLF